MISNTPWKDYKWLPGVLNRRQMRALMDAQLIQSARTEIDWDASALDLHLTSEGYKMKQGSIKPFNKSYKDIISDSYYAEPLIPESDGSFLLETKHCYLFKLREKLHPCIKTAPIYGQSTAKSTFGRVDVIARLIVDGMKEYEKFNPDEIDSGDMFLEITPITFNVKVREELSISQLRFFYGKIENSIIDDLEFIKSILHLRDGELNNGTLSVDVSNDQLKTKNTLAAAFCAKKNIKIPIELWKKPEAQRYVQSDFWDIESSTERDNLKSVKIVTDNFYILRSKERISLPEGVCIYCRAMDETLGEMRIHYAGFVHPCFGKDREDKKKGTPLIFEVRGHNVDILLTQNEILARLYFYRMSENVFQEPEDIEKEKEKLKTMTASGQKEAVSYNNQELTLSTLFQENWN